MSTTSPDDSVASGPVPTHSPNSYLDPGTDALRVSEERFRIVLDSVPTVSVQGYAPDGTVLYWNKASEHLYGYTAEEAIGRSLLDLIIPPQDRETVQKNVLDMVQKGHTIPAGELTLMKKDGSPVFVYSSHACVTRVDGQVEMYCFDIDLAEQKRVEQELQERSRRASAQRSAIAELATNPAINQADFEAGAREIAKVTASTLSVRRAGVWLFNKDCSELNCICVYDSSSDRFLVEASVDIDAMPQYFEAVLREKAFSSTDTHSDPRLENHVAGYLQSRQIFAMLDSAIIVDGQVAGVICVEETGAPRTWHPDEESFARMIAAMLGQALLNAEFKRLANELQQAQKMDSIGRLAGGIAHDFNNMLGVILGHAQLALAEVADTDPIKEDLNGIIETAHHSADLTRKLLAFARRQEIDPRPIQLNEVVGAMLTLLQSLVGKRVKMIWSPGTENCTILADKTQIEQLLTNLCVNARDALGSTGGIIHVRTSSAWLTTDEIATQNEMAPGLYAVLEVEDNGSGMDEETLTHLFEPFYTTKDEGRGTGLGLATVYGIVRQNRGQIHVESNIGTGSCFRIHLPCVEAD